MKMNSFVARLMILAGGIWLAGCSSEPPPNAEVPLVDPATGTAEYWLAKPAAASTYSDDYDKLWEACAATARSDLFMLDRQDYRDGLLTTRPLVSKQIWEFWRNDAGDTYYAMEDSVQTIRRSIEFDFDRRGAGSTVAPKVLIERYAQPNRRITSTGDYRKAFTPIHRLPASAVEEGSADAGYWYSIGRDYEMEAELVQGINQRLGNQ